MKNKIEKMDDLREILADLEHRQWISWTHYLIQNEEIPENLKNKWLKSFIPYSDLSEKYKDMDRVWADRVLRIIYGRLKEDDV